MRYVIAGYVFVLATLFLYAVQLLWRRRRLTRAVARVTGPPSDAAGVGIAASASPGATATPGAASPAVPVGPVASGPEGAR
jgi:hypothetical protein